MNNAAATFLVVESGLVVRGMPYSHTLRTMATERGARAFAAKMLVLKAKHNEHACPAIKAALTISVVAQ